MLYGSLPLPPPCVFNTVWAFKVNGLTSQGIANVGPVFTLDANSQNKHNRLDTVFGDFSYTPTVYGLISDPDLLDAPITHLGFF